MPPFDLVKRVVHIIIGVSRECRSGNEGRADPIDFNSIANTADIADIADIAGFRFCMKFRCISFVQLLQQYLGTGIAASFLLDILLRPIFPHFYDLFLCCDSV